MIEIKKVTSINLENVLFVELLGVKMPLGPPFVILSASMSFLETRVESL